MYICMYIHIYIHTHMYIYIYQNYVHFRTHTHTCLMNSWVLYIQYIWIRVCVCIQFYIYNGWSFVCVCIHTHEVTSSIYIHTYTYADMCMYIYNQQQNNWESRPLLPQQLEYVLFKFSKFSSLIMVYIENGELTHWVSYTYIHTHTHVYVYCIMLNKQQQISNWQFLPLLPEQLGYAMRAYSNCSEHIWYCWDFSNLNKKIGSIVMVYTSSIVMVDGHFSRYTVNSYWHKVNSQQFHSHRIGSILMV